MATRGLNDDGNCKAVITNQRVPVLLAQTVPVMGQFRLENFSLS
jgi:hypothetical protein